MSQVFLSGHCSSPKQNVLLWDSPSTSSVYVTLRDSLTTAFMQESGLYLYCDVSVLVFMFACVCVLFSD